MQLLIQPTWQQSHNAQASLLLCPWLTQQPAARTLFVTRCTGSAPWTELALTLITPTLAGLVTPLAATLPPDTAMVRDILFILYRFERFYLFLQFILVRQRKGNFLDAAINIWAEINTCIHSRKTTRCVGLVVQLTIPCRHTTLKTTQLSKAWESGGHFIFGFQEKYF